VAAFETALIADVGRMLDTRLDVMQAAQMYLSRFQQEAQAVEGLVNSWQEASPRLANANNKGRKEFAIVAIPDDSKADSFGALVQRACPESKLVKSMERDDILFYRETICKLAELPHLGPEEASAYRQLLQSDHFTPHSRIDIQEWRSLTS
jgi:hypothetical protein